MKRNAVYAISGSVLLMLMLSGSCGKVDSIRLDLENGNTELKECVITTMGTGVPGSFNTYDFVYNKLKNPVSATPVGGPATGSPKWLFFYDAKDRLTQYAGVFNDTTSFQFWHKYFYDKQDRIIADSEYTLGDTHHFDQSIMLGLSTITYDHLNRVIQEMVSINFTFGILPPPPRIVPFEYDTRGNLFGSSFAYDNKLNPLLTNKIWRFVSRDYSVNSPLGATSYNEHGFPLHFSDTTQGPNDGVFNPGTSGSSFAGLNIQYDCQDGLDGGHGDY